MTIKRSTLAQIGFVLVLISITGMMSLLATITGCSSSSSAGAGSDSRVPLTEADKQAVAMLGGFGGEWMPETEYIIRLEEPPPSGANWARAWQSKCREAFTIYQTTRGKSPEWLAGLFVHEAQHHVDGCKTGDTWEARANNASRCFKQGIPRSQCEIWRVE